METAGIWQGEISDGTVTYYLKDEAFEKYQFDEETASYNFIGDTFESDYDVLQTFIYRSFQKQQLKNLTIENRSAKKTLPSLARKCLFCIQ